MAGREQPRKPQRVLRELAWRAGPFRPGGAVLVSISSPERWHDQHQYRKELQTSEQHQEA